MKAISRWHTSIITKKPFFDEKVEEAVSNISRIIEPQMRFHPEVLTLPVSDEEELGFTSIMHQQSLIGDALDDSWIPPSKFDLDFSLPDVSPLISDSESS